MSRAAALPSAFCLGQARFLHRVPRVKMSRVPHSMDIGRVVTFCSHNPTYHCSFSRPSSPIGLIVRWLPNSGLEVIKMQVVDSVQLE